MLFVNCSIICHFIASCCILNPCFIEYNYVIIILFFYEYIMSFSLKKNKFTKSQKYVVVFI